GCPPAAAATPTRPKTPGSATQGPEVLAPPSAVPATVPTAAPAVFQTPCRKDDARRRCSSSSKGSKGSVRKMANDERSSVGDSEGRVELMTPACRGGSCAICLSPLKKPSGAKKEVYTVRLCQHMFHRACLVENRRAGNTGCPYCRGDLERGLTPEATAAEREAKVLAAQQQDQREAIRNAAGRARMALARSLRLREEALAREAATAAAAATAAEGGGDSTLVQSY
ncbi:unnamed protein product, partial [Ectocarpus sp. 6 AP-2014]